MLRRAFQGTLRTKCGVFCAKGGVLEWCQNKKRGAFVADWQKNPELGSKEGRFRGREGGSLIQQRLLIETESEGWGHGEKMVEDIGLYGLEFVPNFVFQEKVHFDGQS